MKYIPRGYAEPKPTLERFRKMNEWIMRRGGWVTSLPGADVIVIDVLPGSAVPADLRAAGYDLETLVGGERVTNAGIGKVERFSFAFGDRD